ncbi:MAG: 50S ribosomal protein L35 [Alphaproteobacteria bacterium]|jgi:large subunit ribosomal protein L35|nr:50S ribosomal protein L35 [Alphaproteobacteria bacterium]
MSKLKSKSGAKKRFSLTGTGKIKRNHAGKRHNMRNRAPRMIRSARGTTLLDKADEGRVRRFIPYG